MSKIDFYRFLSEHVLLSNLPSTTFYSYFFVSFIYLSNSVVYSFNSIKREVILLLWLSEMVNSQDHL